MYAFVNHRLRHRLVYRLIKWLIELFTYFGSILVYLLNNLQSNQSYNDLHIDQYAQVTASLPPPPLHSGSFKHLNEM